MAEVKEVKLVPIVSYVNNSEELFAKLTSGEMGIDPNRSNATVIPLGAKGIVKMPQASWSRFMQINGPSPATWSIILVNNVSCQVTDTDNIAPDDEFVGDINAPFTGQSVSLNASVIAWYGLNHQSDVEGIEFAFEVVDIYKSNSEKAAKYVVQISEPVKVDEVLADTAE